MFVMVDYVREMTVKKSCKNGSFELLLFLSCMFSALKIFDREDILLVCFCAIDVCNRYDILYMCLLVLTVKGRQCILLVYFLVSQLL